MAERPSQGSLGEYLLEDGLITAEQLAEAGRRRRTHEQSLGQALLEMGAIGEAQKIASLKKRLALEVVSLEDFDIPPAALGLLPRSFCERNMAVGIIRERSKLVLAMEDPSNAGAIQEAGELCGLKVEPVIASSRDVRNALDKYPEKDAEGRVISGVPEKTRLGRAIHFIVFGGVAILPLPLAPVLRNIDWVASLFRDFTIFELQLTLFLGWALWAVTVYEINGILFGKKR